jgi:hypothetical protein
VASLGLKVKVINNSFRLKVRQIYGV